MVLRNKNQANLSRRRGKLTIPLEHIETHLYDVISFVYLINFVKTEYKVIIIYGN